MAGNFKFVGKVEINSLDSKVAPYRTGNTKSGAPYASFNMSVVPDKSNRAYVEVFGMKRDEIATKDVDGNDIRINWEDRDDPDVMKRVAYYRRFTIEMDGVRHDFISDYDFVQFLIENMNTIKGKIFIVRGGVKPNVYNGKVSLRYTFNSMIEDAEAKPGMTVSNIFYYGSEDIDIADWKQSKTINVNGYTSQYFDKDTGSKYVSTPFVIDCSKADLSNSDVAKKLAFKLKQLGIELENDSIKVKIKRDAIVSVPAECTYINGNEEIPFDESQLSPNQRTAIELGINTIDDFKPKGNIYGARVSLLKYKSSDLRSPYDDGCKVEDVSAKDFKDMIFKETVTETVADLDKNDDSDNDDLFS